MLCCFCTGRNLFCSRTPEGRLVRLRDSAAASLLHRTAAPCLRPAHATWSRQDALKMPGRHEDHQESNGETRGCPQDTLPGPSPLLSQPPSPHPSANFPGNKPGVVWIPMLPQKYLTGASLLHRSCYTATHSTCRRPHSRPLYCEE